MQEAAHISAAIEVLDRALGGTSLDAALTNWGRAHRFAGSGDRAAIRDLVFDAWRCRRSFAAFGGAETGRGLMLGRARATGQDVAALFTGIGHAPLPPTAAEVPRPASENEALDCPDWLAPRLRKSLGSDFAPVMRALQQRAPAFLRVNLARISRSEAADLLASEAVETTPHGLADSALEIVTSTRKILTTKAYLDGMVELQDAASQAVVAAIPLSAGQRVLDYCAGGGGKTLALAARARLDLWAHDSNPARMRDLPGRAARAGVAIGLLTNPGERAPYDLVLADVPCSGSGSWRRDPAGKWALTEPGLADLIRTQAEILDLVAPLVTPDGLLAYATCSLLDEENQDQIAGFLQRFPDWQQLAARKFTPLEGGDGFFLSILRQKAKQ